MIRRPTHSVLRVLAAASALVVAGMGTLTFAANPDVLFDALLQRPASSGTVVVPDRFLRSWDPITVFFPAGRGPNGGGPEDAPDRHARLAPAHPGAWTWLDARTLQFRPAEPWPPLETLSVAVDGGVTTLSSLLPPPSLVDPPHGAVGLQPVETVTVTFARPLDPKMLARMTNIELRPLPGLGSGPVSWLRSTDFEIKVLERAGADAPASYAIVLRNPIPLGYRGLLRVALSHDEASEEAVFESMFSTAEPFRPLSIGCDGGVLPVSSEGTTHPSERPLRCVRDRFVRIDFSATLGGVGPLEGRNLVRFEPAVEGLRFDAGGSQLRVRGDFRPEVPYRVSLVPAPFTDANQRPLEIRGESVAWVYFPRRESQLSWGVAQGVAELRGPQRVPVSGTGVGEVDVRVYRVEPTNRSFWPFPEEPIEVNEEVAPPGPGEGPSPWTDLENIPPHELAARIAALGTPARSEVVPVGLGGDRSGRVGLDLAPILERAAGRRPGHWLVGLRRLDGSAERRWIRLQVTDLALTTVENETDVWFQVTSLQTGLPVAGASIKLEGPSDNEFVPFATLRTSADGSATWKAPGTGSGRIARISVQSGEDVLVLDTDRPPDRFEDGTWLEGYAGWLDWVFQDLTFRAEQPRTKVHLFSERPIYRPGDEVHLKGYARTRFEGHLTPVTGSATVHIEGPSYERDLDVELSESGSFDVTWREEEPATGVYTATLSGAEEGSGSGRATFRVEAYRLPTFEVDLRGPRNVTTLPNDAAFGVNLSSSYYAGGKVSGRPVRWRVTQYPYAWQPKVGAYEGFAWSSDDRYSRGGGFRESPELAIDGTTTADGAASITLDPGLEPDGRARTWVVEATVTGADDQTVTSNLSLNTVPAFVLGLEAPRWLDEAKAIPIRVVAVGPDGSPRAGLELVVKTVHREWHSVLQQSDFTTGEARYLTDVVDVPAGEQKVTSSTAPQAVSLPITEPGVYLVEVEARDALGRVQVVRTDLFARGEGAVSWEKPKAGTFDLSLDRASYQPGQTARMVIRSPFQEAQALVVIEAPDGNRYEQVAVRGGQATVSLPVKTGWVPSLPVHVVLRRGRGLEAATVGRTDLERPQTVAATTTLVVEPVENKVAVALKVPDRALPGETVPVTVTLKDPRGKPLAGEVTLWMVDKAVLALAKESRLDPVPDFVDARGSHLSVRDTRNQVLGQVAYEENPGGDGEEGQEGGVLSNATVRKDFRPLAYWEPSLKVPASGTLTVQVKLPDNATVWAVRAKAAAGTERFGSGTAELPVRLPVVVEPALPRFVRPGDSFTAGALARVVEGPGGPGAAEVSVRGLVVGGAKTQALDLDPAKAARAAWTLAVPTPAVGPRGALATTDVSVKVGARRTSDGASDAFEITLPLFDDRRPRYERTFVTLAPGASTTVPAVREAVREGSVERSVVVASDEAVVRMAAAVDVLRRSVAEGSDATLSRGRVALGLGALRGPLGLEDQAELDAIVTDTMRWLGSATDPRGLVAQWPGTPGRVWLTADTVAFLAEARAQKYPVDEELLAVTTRALTASLRSDYRYFVSGEAWTERATALWGLSAGNRLDPAFVSELERNSRYLAPESRAKVLLASSRGGVQSPAMVRLAEELSGQITLERFQGVDRYSGLSFTDARSPFIAPSETRQLATITQALVATRPDDPKLPLVRDALVRLGAENGWGQPNADAAALLALGDWLKSGSLPTVSASVDHGGAKSDVSASGPVARMVAVGSATTTITNTGKAPLVALVATRWIPKADGSEVQPEAHGFVVEREWLVVNAQGPMDRSPVTGGAVLRVQVGDVIEEHVRLVNPEERYHVALTVPLAAGVEPMNPALATAGRDAAPTNVSTGKPSWSAYLDDRVRYAFETLPKGTYDLYFRTRVSLDGSFVQPAAWAELVYDRDVNGNSAGGRVLGAKE